MNQSEKEKYREIVANSLIRDGFYKTKEEALKSFDDMTVCEPCKNKLDIAKCYECDVNNNFEHI